MPPKNFQPPKTLPFQGHDTYQWSEQANFSTYAAAFEPRTFQALLFQRQREQLWLPQQQQLWPGIPDFPDATLMPQRLMELSLQHLPVLASTLYPGREHPALWTNFELQVVARTYFAFVVRQLMPNVPRTLNVQSMCTFMLWVTYPLVTLVPRFADIFSGQPFQLCGSDCVWGSNNTLNFSFSPRSALLMFIFGLSIRHQAGHPNFTHLGHTLVTLGFRLRWEKWNELLAASNLWNRRYLDYFVGMTGTVYLHPVLDKATIQSMVTLTHPLDPYFAVDVLNRTFSRDQPDFYRLYHIPVPTFAWQALQWNMTWDFVPRELFQHFARPRL